MTLCSLLRDVAVAKIQVEARSCTREEGVAAGGIASNGLALDGRLKSELISYCGELEAAPVGDMECVPTGHGGATEFCAWFARIAWRSPYCDPPRDRIDLSVGEIRADFVH